MSDDPLLGTDVGRYRLVKLLGQGGMGRVYAAVQPDVGSRVAIKVLNEELVRDAELTARFVAEARAINTIRHEGIVNVLDLVTLADGRPGIVMELIEGDSLREILRGPPVSLGAVVNVMLDVLGALAAAHAAGVVHRDLKPDNILVTAGGRAKVLDFGIAKVARPGAGQTTPRTRTGAVLGTPEYMAPEQISGGMIDARTDIYAAGVVLFEATTGRRPFDGASDFEVMRAHVDDAPPSPRALRAAIPVGIEHVIYCALSKSPGQRFASATAMANALHGASASLADGEWHSLTPHGRAFARPAPPAPEPHMSESLVGVMSPATVPTRSLPTARAMPEPQERAPELATPTVSHRTPVVPAPAAAPVPVLAGRRPWLAVGAGATLLALGALGGIVASRSGAGPGAGSGPAGSGAGSSATSNVTSPGVDAALPGAAQAASTLPFDGDPLHFDPSAFLPRAIALAEAKVPGVKLSGVIFDPVSPSGLMDLRSVAMPTAVYSFEETPVPGQHDCGASVMVNGDAILVVPGRTPSCTNPPATPVRCTIAEAWTRGLRKLAPAVPVRMGLNRRIGAAGIWWFSMPDGSLHELPDDCASMGF